MLAAIFQAPGNFELGQKDLRSIGPDEVLLQVSACGVCGTDIQIIAGKSHASPPVILGHEFCGEIIEKGGYVADLKPGDIVAVDPNIVCGHCSFCRRGKINLCEKLTALGVNIDGGFAEYALVPQSQCYLLPQDTDVRNAALLEPLSCALYGIEKAGVTPGDTVIVIGGGFIGHLMLTLLRMVGAGRLIVLETDPKRQASLRKFGADEVYAIRGKEDENVFMERTRGGGDVVLECVGSPETVAQALRIAQRGARVVIFGVSPNDESLPVSPYDIFYRDLTIIGSFINPFTFAKAVDLLAHGRVDFRNLDIAEFPLSRICGAIENHRQRRSLKTLIRNQR